MTAKEKDEMMHGLALAKAMCMENRDGCRSCIFNGTYTGCMFRSKQYPARWNLEGTANGRIKKAAEGNAEKTCRDQQ